MLLVLLTINIYNRVAEVVPILQVWLTVQVQTLKYKKKLLKNKSLK